MNALDQVNQAITNVLTRKRKERLALQMKIAECQRKREAPPKEWPLELHLISREIKSLEAAL